MPEGNACDHKRCDGGPCKKLTSAELEPATEDMAFAKLLIEEGWLSASTKHRRIARATDKFPTAEALIKPEALQTEHGKLLAELWHYHRLRILKRYASGADDGLVEEQTLTVKQFRAFKRLNGGAC